MYGCKTVILVFKLFFGQVNGIVCLKNILVARHFCVERNKTSARTVIVDNQIVDTDNRVIF